MATNIRDRLQAKLKPSNKAVLGKRTLTKSEDALVRQLLQEYSPDKNVEATQIKLIRETDDTKLVEAIFERIEKCFHPNNTYRAMAIRFVYKLQEKSLIAKIEEDIISELLIEKAHHARIESAIDDLFFIGDPSFVKRAMEAIPAKNRWAIEDLLAKLDKKFVDLAIDIFLQPKYNYLPLLTLLSDATLLEAQSNKIIDSITKEGLDLQVEGKDFTQEYLPHKIVPALTQKIIEVGWDYWRTDYKNMTLHTLVFLLLNSKEPDAKRMLLENFDFNRGNITNIDTLGILNNLAFLFGLAKMLGITVDSGRFAARLDKQKLA